MNLTYWNAMIDIGFWTRLAKKKIEEYKLSSDPKPLTCKYRLSNKPEKISIISIDAFSFGDFQGEDKSGPVEFRIKGEFINTNTIQDFNSTIPEDKQKQLIAKQTLNIQKIINGETIPQISEVFLLIFADLKKHFFTYQFYSTSIPVKNYKVHGFESAETLDCKQLNHLIRNWVNNEGVPQFAVLRNLEVSNIKQFLADPSGDYLFLVRDITNLPKSTGYHTTSILALFALLRKQKLIDDSRLQKINLLLLKQFLINQLQKDYTFKSSEVVTFDLSEIEIGSFQERLSHKNKVLDIDLKSFMDERTLAREAVDLNIKLMKWRLLPTLNIPKIQAARCLLFGAGTLGCQLARSLIGWGIKNITLIDYSKVSYSNPVRQTLYEYEDTINGGKPKAETAALRLKKIYPQINAQGFSLSIPMPGHYVIKEEHIKETFETLDTLQKLVSEHDVLFLLLDSREARWLPTVLANKYNKACITVGLGFDSFVIVRHGVSPNLFNPQMHRERLCCYFCNDIVTPQNTMKDRTLDQMCTVTKPGLSFVSAAYATELYISLLHHPLEHHAPASEDSSKLQVTELGKLPHHLRGNMSDYQTSMFYGQAFQQCVACSKPVLDAYLENRDEFMLTVLNDPTFIHRVTKLQDELDSYAKMEFGIIEIMDEQSDFVEISFPEERSKETETGAKL